MHEIQGHSRTCVKHNSLFAVQELLGHAKADTTRIYVETPSDARRRAVLGAVQLGAVATPA